MTAVRAVLFDLDGTLLDTLEDLADATNEVLAAQGFPVHPVDAYRYFVGSGLEQLIIRALPAEHRDTGIIRRSMADFHRVYGRLWDNKTRPYPGVEEMLATLAQRGIGMGVCTNKPEAFAQLCVKRLLPGGHFEVVLGAVDGRPKKPAPDIALEAARMLGAAPAACVFVGDSCVDMDTAVAARMLPIGALWGFREAAELREHGARHLITGPSDLAELLEQVLEEGR